MKTLALSAALLVLVITSASAFLRLSQSGLGCAGWPACYGAAGAARTGAIALERAEPTAFESAVRWAHRIAASLLVLLLLAMAVPGWDVLPGRGGRVVIVLLLALVGGLAWLGRMTPSPLPAVTFGNMAGGFLMVGLLARLAVSLGPRPARWVSPWLAWVLLGGIALQLLLGALLSSRLAAASCAAFPACEVQWATVEWQAFNPFASLDGQPAGGATLAALHVLHRAVGAAVSAGALWLAWTTVRSERRALLLPMALATLALAQGAVGVLVALFAGPLAMPHGLLSLAVAHNVLAALLVAALFAGMAPGMESRS